MVPEDERRRPEVIKAARIAAAVDRMRTEPSAFFALVAAAPDRQTLVGWLIDRFQVERYVAEAVLHQSIISMIPKR